MKYLLLLTGSMFFVCFSCLAQNNDVEALKKMNHDWLNAYITKDTATLSKILADDFKMVNPNGAIQNKKDNLQNMLDPNVQTLSVGFDKVEVELLKPDVAILTAWTNFTFKANGKQMTGKNSYQDVYQKRKGKWVAVAAHVTSLGMQ